MPTAAALFVLLTASALVFTFVGWKQHYFYESLPGQPPHHGIDRNVLWPASSSKLASVLPPGSPRLPH